MSHHRRQLIEKLQVVVAAVAALLLVWFVAWPLVRPWDVQGPLVFLPLGAGASLAVFAASVWLVSGLCAALTISARPEGSLLAALAAVAGFSLRGGPMHNLLWRWEASGGELFALLALEVLVLAGVLLVAVVVVGLVRALVGRLLPWWRWVEVPQGPPGVPAHDLASRLLPPQHRTGLVAGLVGGLAGLLLELAVALLLLVVTFRSQDRGQIDFALAASFLLAALAAHQVFPVRRSLPLLLAPLLAGAVVFLIGGGPAAAFGAGPAWYQAIHVAQRLPMRAALPVDWLAFGCGGAVAGVWFSRRINEARHLEERDEKEKPTGKPAAVEER